MRGAYLSQLVLIAVFCWPPDCEGGERKGERRETERAGADGRVESAVREREGRIARICIGGMVCMFLPAVQGWLANKPRSVI